MGADRLLPEVKARDGLDIDLTVGLGLGLMAADQSPPLVQLVTALVPVVSLLLTLLGGWLTKVVASKLKTDEQRAIALNISELASDVVLELQQTTVDAIKERAQDGKITGEEAAEIKQLAVARLKVMIGPKGKAKALKAFGFESDAELNAFIATKIEAEVRKARATVGRVLSSVFESTNKPE